VIKIDLKDVKIASRTARGVTLVRFKGRDDKVSAIALE